MKEVDGKVEHPGFSYAFIMSLQCTMTMARSLPLPICKKVTKVVVLILENLIIVEDHPNLWGRHKERRKKMLLSYPHLPLQITQKK